MTKTSTEIAQEALPGWKVVRGPKDKVSRADLAQGSTPDLAELRQRYLGDAAATADAFASASSLGEDESEYVVMEPADASGGQRRVVVVSRGRAVAIQG